MHISSSDIKDFYNSEIGSIILNIIGRHISGFWQDIHGLRVMGCGYATPYLSFFANKNSERIIAMIPPRQGAYNWGISDNNKKNAVFLSSESKMPVESCSIDRVLAVHYLENCDNLQESLTEIWRVLKANGRLLIIVPNRVGIWARTEWTPFGFGRPFSFSQLSNNLKISKFIIEGHKGALFVPPIPNSPIIMKSANLIEKMGGNILPFAAGVHIVEASKQIYATIDSGSSGASVIAKTKEILSTTGGGKAAIPQGFKSPKDYLDRFRP